MQQNQFQPFRTLFICKNDCVTTKNKQNIQKKRPIFHRPLHCCTFRGQFLTAVFLFLDILLKLRAVALRFTDLRQPLFGRGIRIRTLNDGVRVRSVTVTLYLYINISFLTLRKNKWYYTHRNRKSQAFCKKIFYLCFLFF